MTRRPQRPAGISGAGASAAAVFRVLAVSTPGELASSR